MKKRLITITILSIMFLQSENYVKEDMSNHPLENLKVKGMIFPTDTDAASGMMNMKEENEFINSPESIVIGAPKNDGKIPMAQGVEYKDMDSVLLKIKTIQ